MKNEGATLLQGRGLGRDEYVCAYSERVQRGSGREFLSSLLLLVNYAKPEVDLICLLEVGCHAHDLRESLLSVLK